MLRNEYPSTQRLPDPIFQIHARFRHGQLPLPNATMQSSEVCLLGSDLINAIFCARNEYALVQNLQQTSFSVPEWLKNRRYLAESCIIIPCKLCLKCLKFAKKLILCLLCNKNGWLLVDAVKHIHVSQIFFFFFLWWREQN